MRSSTGQPAAQLVYETLKEEICNGVIPSDAPLREQELAERFGVSRTPVREALHRLSSEKLVRTIPNVGSIAGNLTWEEAREIFSIREVLEAYAGGLTAQFVDEEIIGQLERLLDVMQEAASHRDSVAYAAADGDFHSLINNNCRNRNLSQLIEQLNDKAKLANLHRILYVREENIDKSLECHRQIVEAIKKHDSQRAAQLLLEHGDYIFGGITQQTSPTSIFRSHGKDSSHEI